VSRRSGSNRLARVATREPEPGGPFKPWQWVELWGLLFVVVVQLWLYRISVVAGAAWGLLVPALLIHIYSWMAPMVRAQDTGGPDERRE
jgi:hypothetical protein